MGSPTVVGIDVGGEHKGFHAVALSEGRFEARSSKLSTEITAWCLDRGATVVAVDAPCRWSRASSSRRAERELKLGAAKIHCFATPTRAAGARKRFYDWVFNGERLYEQLAHHFRLFDGERRDGAICFETFPHAILCSLAGRIVPAKPKAQRRRQALRDLGYDVRALTNIDLVDAGLCAVAAERFRAGRTTQFGERDEGFIVVPACRRSEA